MIVFVNGDFVDGDRAVSAGDRGLLLGHGAFETIYVEGGACAFLEAHLQRLERGLDALGLHLAAHDWRDLARILAQRNGVSGRGAFRITVTGGGGGRGLAAAGPPTVIASLSGLADPSGSCRARVVRQARCSASIAARFKLIGGYVDNIAALAEARAQGGDEAIMLNERGDLACASVANIFLVAPDGAVTTPRCEDGALAGVVRSLLLCGDHGVKIAERAIGPAELSESMVFLTNSLRGVAPCAGGERSAAASGTVQMLQRWYGDTLARELCGS